MVFYRERCPRCSLLPHIYTTQHTLRYFVTRTSVVKNTRRKIESNDDDVTHSVVVVLVEDWFTWRRYSRCRIFAPTDINIASNKDQKLHLKQILQIGDEIWRKWDKDAISKPCQLFENTRSLVHNDRIVMHGVLSIYIFKRYQSSEILIKDKNHQRQGRESTDIPALLCSPSPIPPAYWNPSQKLRSKEVKQLRCPKESRQHPNFPSEIPSGELVILATWKNINNHSGKASFLQIAT